jgi:hypothetical protein
MVGGGVTPGFVTLPLVCGAGEESAPSTSSTEVSSIVTIAATARADNRIPDALRSAGIRLPGRHERLRTAFVGQETYFLSSALNQAAGGLEPRFFDFRADTDFSPVADELADFRPHVIVVFRPEIVPAAALVGCGALRIGFLTEPLPRRGPDGAESHPDLVRRLRYLKAIDPANFDRIVSFDPLVAATASDAVPVFRSFPLPVADEFFLPVEPYEESPRPLFLGRSTEHRELWLAEAKHHFDTLHIAHGISGDELLELMAKPAVSINIHNEPYPTFEVRVPLCMAAGHLVVSEKLSPSHGLEPGSDHIEALVPNELVAALSVLERDPNAFFDIRVFGRMKAEQFRASKVWPRLIDDTYLDVSTFGIENRGPGR